MFLVLKRNVSVRRFFSAPIALYLTRQNMIVRKYALRPTTLVRLKRYFESPVVELSSFYCTQNKSCLSFDLIKYIHKEHCEFM